MPETRVHPVCMHCGEPVLPREQDLHFQTQAMHVECGFRLVGGSVAHINRRCSCVVPGSTEGDPEDVSVRQAARLALWAYRAQNDCRGTDQG